MGLAPLNRVGQVVLADECLERTKGMFMKTTRVMAVATLIATTGLVLHAALAQPVGARRIDVEKGKPLITVVE
jgi:hypothetical protein